MTVFLRGFLKLISKVIALGRKLFKIVLGECAYSRSGCDSTEPLQWSSVKRPRGSPAKLDFCFLGPRPLQ